MPSPTSTFNRLSWILFHFARLCITSQSIAYRLASFCCSGVSSEKGLGVIPRGINWFGTVNRTLLRKACYEGEERNVKQQEAQVSKPTYQVIWILSHPVHRLLLYLIWRQSVLCATYQELGNEGVSTMLHTMLPHHRMKTSELTSNKLRSLSNRLSTKRFTFVIAFCKSILDKRLVELATQFSCTEMTQRCSCIVR